MFVPPFPCYPRAGALAFAGLPDATETRERYHARLAAAGVDAAFLTTPTHFNMLRLAHTELGRSLAPQSSAALQRFLCEAAAAKWYGAEWFRLARAPGAPATHIAATFGKFSLVSKIVHDRGLAADAAVEAAGGDTPWPLVAGLRRAGAETALGLSSATGDGSAQ